MLAAAPRGGFCAGRPVVDHRGPAMLTVAKPAKDGGSSPARSAAVASSEPEVSIVVVDGDDRTIGSAPNSGQCPTALFSGPGRQELLGHNGQRGSTTRDQSAGRVEPTVKTSDRGGRWHVAELAEQPGGATVLGGAGGAHVPPAGVGADWTDMVPAVWGLACGLGHHWCFAAGRQQVARREAGVSNLDRRGGRDPQPEPAVDHQTAGPVRGGRRFPHG